MASLLRRQRCLFPSRAAHGWTDCWIVRAFLEGTRSTEILAWFHQDKVCELVCLFALLIFRRWHACKRNYLVKVKEIAVETDQKHDRTFLSQFIGLFRLFVQVILQAGTSPHFPCCYLLMCRWCVRARCQWKPSPYDQVCMGQEGEDHLGKLRLSHRAIPREIEISALGRCGSIAGIC